MKTYNIICFCVFFFILKGNGFAAWGGGNISTSSQTITCPGPVNFYDDGGSGGNYADSKDYTLTVTASTAGQCLNVAFSVFNVESCCDYLKIYDGVGTGTLLGTYAGTTLPPSTTSSSGSLTFVFHSDGSLNYAGWAATISCTTCPTPSVNMSNTSASLTCPTSVLFYDSGGSGGNYSASESYTKTFTASAGSCVSYTFNAFNTESGFDYLSIYDGATTASPLIGTYSGTSLPPNFTASGTSLTFRFTSDGSGQYAGWTATVACANGCSGAPTAGTAAASPTAQCGTFTTSLTLTGASSGCGITYQWYQSNASAGTYTAIGSASSTSTQTYVVSSTTYFKCVTMCGASSATTSVIIASISPTSIGTGVFSVSLPYTITGQTTCGSVNDITSSNVTNICGSSNYYGGEDVVYVFTPTVTAVLNANVASTGSYMGIMLYNGCPTSTAGVCVANSQSSAGNQNLGCAATVSAGVTYFLMLDSYPSPTCNPYDLTLSLNNCSSAPASGNAVATPSSSCGTYTTTLSLTSPGTGCNVTYQWYQSNASAGTYTAIASTSSATTQTFVVSGSTYFKCVVSCGAYSSTTSVISATINPTSVGTGVFSVSIPYTITGQTTCGFVDDITSSNVTNICGSSNYYTGEDVVYVFTPTVTTVLNANVTSTGSHMGMMLYNGCPTSTAGVCVANAQSSAGNQNLGCAATVSAGVTYYLMLDSRSSPSCNPYDLSLSLNNCSSAPASGNAVATPSTSCGIYTTTLSLTSPGTGCNVTYQWYQSNASAGTYTPIASASSAITQTFVVSGTTYFKCVVSCGAYSSTTSVISATINPLSVGTGVYAITAPYSTTGQTTCGSVNDITSSNVTNVCGSSSYYTGEDVVYVFTPTVTSAFTASVTSSGSYMGMTLYQGCPLAAGVCVANAQSSSGNQTLSSAGCSSAITVSAGVTYYLVLDSYAAPSCNPYNLSISLPTTTTVSPCNLAYTVSSPTYSFETFSGTILPTTDDVLFSSVVLFGFTVCFDGLSFNGGYVSSNAAFVFDAVPCFPNIQTSTYAAGGVSTGYSITNPAPINNTSVPRNAILAPWHDINPTLGGIIQYTVMGTAPSRRFILSYENVPMYSCGTSSPSIYYSGQIKIFETSNNIEIHVKQKKVCPGWNNGQAILGLHNYSGTIYTPPVNATLHNAVASPGPYNQWTMANTAYRFSTTCGASSTCGMVLPIGMKTFYGERVDKINDLYWETASEDNLKKYTIQRSTDAVNFMDIGEVMPNNLPSKYSFEDRNAALGIINYYRIAIYENDGTVNFTSIISLGSGNNEILNVSQIYPNPVNSSFAIALNSRQKGSVTINVYDVFGHLVRSADNDVQGGVTQYEISVGDLSNGVYYVEILNSFNEVISKQKFIKN